MSDLKPLLIEIGTEEIPAGVAPRMGEALRAALESLLTEAGIKAEGLRLGVTPRRLLVYAPACPTLQPDREQILWGPPEHVAFKDGAPTKAAQGFANKAGVAVAELELAEKGDGKGRYLRAVTKVTGRRTAELIAEAMPGILRNLPSPKRMKWQDGEAREDAFIRPIRWIVARIGDELIRFSFAGVPSGLISHGHRIHGGSGELDIRDPFAWLEKQYVIADRDARKRIIAEELAKAAQEMGVRLLDDEELLNEVTDLVEWPQVVAGRYKEEFLRLPEEVSRIELKQHQRCFAARTPDGAVSNVFFAVANIQSKDPSAVAKGNERVVNARLADAAFYFDRDPERTLEERVEQLSGIVFQDGLGMVGDQVRRLRGFVLDNARALGVDADLAQRAAYLCKSDLTTGLVSEFPELQGYMGGIYARMDGEDEAVAAGIAEHYAPVGADDPLPSNAIARAIGIAERADKLLGYFHLGRVPTATADPFGLRRAAIGLIRLLEGETMPVRMTLGKVLKEAAKQWNQQRATIAVGPETIAAVKRFVHERLYGMAEHFKVSRNALDAALHAGEEKTVHQQVAVARLLTGFAESEAGLAVVAANKRIANILKKAGEAAGEVDASLLSEDAEKALFAALRQAEAGFPEDVEAQLQVLATLREPVDRFFDEVMVMTDDPAIRANRLALLSRLRRLFLRLADLSRL